MTEEIKNILKKFRVNVNAPNLLQELFDAIPQKITVDNFNYWFTSEKLTDGSWRLYYVNVYDDDDIIVEVENISLQEALITIFCKLNELRIS